MLTVKVEQLYMKYDWLSRKVYKIIFEDKKVAINTVAKFTDGGILIVKIFRRQPRIESIIRIQNLNTIKEIKWSYAKDSKGGNLVKQTMKITEYIGQTEKIIASYEGGKVKKVENKDHYEYTNQKIVFDVDQASNPAELLYYQWRLYLSVTDYDLFIIDKGIKKYNGISTITDKVLNTKEVIEFKTDEKVYKKFENNTSDKVMLISKHKSFSEYFDIKETLEANSELKNIKIEAKTGKLGFISKGEKIKLPDSITKLTKADNTVTLSDIESGLSAIKVDEAQYFLENVGNNKFNAYIALNTDGNEGYQAGSDILITISGLSYKNTLSAIEDHMITLG